MRAKRGGMRYGVVSHKSLCRSLKLARSKHPITLTATRVPLASSRYLWTSPYLTPPMYDTCVSRAQTLPRVRQHHSQNRGLAWGERARGTVSHGVTSFWTPALTHAVSATLIMSKRKGKHALSPRAHIHAGECRSFILYSRGVDTNWEPGI